MKKKGKAIMIILVILLSVLCVFGYILTHLNVSDGPGMVNQEGELLDSLLEREFVDDSGNWKLWFTDDSETYRASSYHMYVTYDDTLVYPSQEITRQSNIDLPMTFSSLTDTMTLYTTENTVNPNDISYFSNLPNEVEGRLENMTLSNNSDITFDFTIYENNQAILVEQISLHAASHMVDGPGKEEEVITEVMGNNKKYHDEDNEWEAWLTQVGEMNTVQFLTLHVNRSDQPVFGNFSDIHTANIGEYYYNGADKYWEIQIKETNQEPYLLQGYEDCIGCIAKLENVYRHDEGSLSFDFVIYENDMVRAAETVVLYGEES